MIQDVADFLKYKVGNNIEMAREASYDMFVHKNKNQK